VAHLFLKDTVLSDRRLPLPGRVVVLGRSLDADVPIPHRSVSRRHALIERSERGYTISDLGSHNGTFVGGKRLLEGERVEIGLGAAFTVGKVAIALTPDEVIEGEGLALETPGRPASAVAAGTSAAVAPAVAAPAPQSPSKPRRAAAVRRRRGAVGRWVAAGVTVVLLAAAGGLLLLLLHTGGAVGNGTKRPPAGAAPGEQDGVLPIRLPQPAGEGGAAGSEK
jgi:hypothetical protein